MVPEPFSQHSLKRAISSRLPVFLVGGTEKERMDVAKTVLSLLPPLGTTEAEEIRENHRAARVVFGPEEKRPFRKPQATITMGGLCGSGLRSTPGETALAHGGVLFLKKAEKFGKGKLAALLLVWEAGCSPAESRGGNSSAMPAHFLLVAGFESLGGLEASPMAALWKRGSAVCLAL